MRKYLLIILLITAVSLIAAEEVGRLAGKITHEKSGAAIGNVSVFIEKLGKGISSKENGTYILNDIPAGKHSLIFQLIGFKSAAVQIEIIANQTTVVNVQMKPEAVLLEGMKVTANRAVPRETPVAFTDVDEKTIKEKYTTGDMPQMLEDIPGLFATTSGLGEAEISMRGFNAQRIQILINGIPANDPESQIVYWSNWTGLSSNVKSVQVQRGSGASLYGSGAIGGSVNIETMGSANDQEFTIRSSGGYYTTDGISADNDGVMKDYNPMNYNFLLKFDSGKILNDKFKYNLTAERKAGDYYIRGTNYDGWSFGAETENKFGNHILNTSFIAAPQKHNQARSTYDRELGKHLGREYNHQNHEWQENKYFKPQLSFRDKWIISPKSTMMTNLFGTIGIGGGSYANNIIFDAESGEMIFRSLRDADDEAKMLAKYAYYVYNQTGGADGGYLIDGLEIEDWNGIERAHLNWGGEAETVYSGSNTLDSPLHTSKRTSYNKHKQIGLNTYFDREITDNVDIIIGAESRWWRGNHYKEGSEFRHNNPEDPDSVSTFGAFLREYDYTTDVINTSGFARSKINIPFENGIESINLMLDGQYAVYYSEVNENLIKYYDFVKDEYINAGNYATKMDSTGTPVWEFHDNGDSTITHYVYNMDFNDDDYKRTFTFFSPKLGINVNLNKQWNVLANYSVVYKEPRVADWYNRELGPGTNQKGDDDPLRPEKGETIEGGIGYKNEKLKFDVSYYHTKYTDRIEKTQIGQGEQGYSATVNCGEALHQGVELAFKGAFGNFDTNASATFAKNRWDKLNDEFEQLFYEEIGHVEGKVVPFSPEKMASGGLGYTFQEMPLSGSLRIGFNAKWTDDYYTTYDNVYCKQLYYYDDDGNFISIGEHEFVENTDGTGEYDYNESTEEYFYVQNDGAFDREWILSSSKLPAFFELNGSMSYKFNIGNHETSIKLNVNNILNRKDNYSKAYISKAYGLQTKQADGSYDDPEFGEGSGTGHYPYLSPSPLLNVFLTVEYKF
jgi:outer membrane receptor protein involved in Fe transport